VAVCSFGNIDVQLVCHRSQEIHVEVNPDATRLLLIRHAHIDTGKDPRMCGWLDLPLSPTGVLQLQRFHKESSEFKPHAIYASSSTRARLTAEALASNWSLDVSIDPQLREVNCGTLEGMPIEEVKHRYPELWAENAVQNNSDFSWPNGESYTNFRHRVFMTLTRIARQHSNARIAVVTHAGVIAQVAGAVKGLSPAVWEQYRPAPFTATEVIWSGEAPLQLLSFNVTDWWRGAQLHA
jgi:broad specificity phosphatase PhoE